jgi:hypothetical protein
MYLRSAEILQSLPYLASNNRSRRFLETFFHFVLSHLSLHMPRAIAFYNLVVR